MRLRRAAALALAGWYLTITGGKTVPKDCPDCAAVTMEQWRMLGGAPFATKAECEKAGKAQVRAFSKTAEENSVVVPSSFLCTEGKLK